VLRYASLSFIAACFFGSAVFTPVQAQNFSNTIFFGDSTTDSGRYLYLPGTVGKPGSQAPPGLGAWTTNPGLEWSVALGQRFGITVTPSDAPSGGNNYAAGGARVAIPVPTSNAWSATDRINAYLASTGGRADPNALYTMWIGANDLAPTSVPNILGNNAAIVALAQQTEGLISTLHADGARYILVPNTESFLGSPLVVQSKALYDATIWNGLAAQGINFIPADYNGLVKYVYYNPSQFGILVTSIATPACNVTYSYLQCGPANLVTPNADRTYFFADKLGHQTTAVQQIISDYAYSLIVAPSQISFLAENAVKARTRLVNAIQNQIDVSQDQRGPTGFNAWVTGDVSHLGMDNYNGFPNDPSTPAALAAGVDYRWSPQIIVGGVISTGTQRSSFSTTGNFTEDEIAASIFAGYRGGPWWGNAIATYGHLDYAVNRTVPLGITFQSNSGSTSGNDWSLAAEGGYKFREGRDG
jgi:outer membrane lipase/esterase